MKKHINIILLILAISLGLFSCSQSKIKENKAKKLALKELKTQMNDWQSYESVSWGKLDTMCNQPPLSNKFFFSYLKKDFSYKFDSLALADSLKKIPQTDKRYNIINDSINHIKMLLSKNDKSGWSYLYKNYLVGYRIEHTFRGNNGYGGKVINKVEFFFDKDLTKVIKIDDPNNPDEEDGKFIYH